MPANSYFCSISLIYLLLSSLIIQSQAQHLLIQDLQLLSTTGDSILFGLAVPKVQTISKFFLIGFRFIFFTNSYIILLLSTTVKKQSGLRFTLFVMIHWAHMINHSSLYNNFSWCNKELLCRTKLMMISRFLTVNRRFPWLKIV